MEAPSLGVTHILRNALSANRSRADLALRAASQLGDVVRLPVPGRKVYLVSGPAATRRVMIQNHDNYTKSFDYEILAELLGQGLLTAHDDEWKRDRKLVIGLFQQQKLAEFAPIMRRCIDEMLESWNGRDSIAIDLEMNRVALRIIGFRLLGLDVGEFTEAIGECLDVCQKHIVARGNALFDLAKHMKTPAQRRFERSLAKLDSIVAELLARRRAGGGGEDLVALLERAGQSPKQIRDQLVTFFLAGHETSAVAMTWLFHLLSLAPETQDRLAREPELSRAVIEESLRLYPAVSFMGRQALADDELGGFEIPAGAIIVLCPWATQRRPDLWDRVNEFDPGRWAPGAREKIPVGAWYPFALGPRGCMGLHFAFMEMQMIVDAVISRYRVSPDPRARNVKPVPLISMRPDRILWLRIDSR